MGGAEITRRRDGRSGHDVDGIDDDDGAVGTGDADVDGGGAEAVLVLEEVIRLAGGGGPGGTAVGADLEAGDGAVGVDDLHAEPVGGHAVLVVQLQGRGDPALDEGPADGDDARRGRRQAGEGVGEEVEVVGATAGTLIYDLGRGGCQS